MVARVRRPSSPPPPPPQPQCNAFGVYEGPAVTSGPAAAPVRFQKRLLWQCRECRRVCIPIREEQRCLCGHRMREHQDCGGRCAVARCKCRSFFYIFAEGSFVLRCRCKHKHTEHDCSAAPYRCARERCACRGFDSPWVCNCDHPWADHEQVQVEMPVESLNPYQLDADVGNPYAVARGQDVLTAEDSDTVASSTTVAQVDRKEKQGTTR